MASLIDFNIKQLTIMIDIMDVIIFQNIIAGIYFALKMFVYFMPTFSDRG